MVFKHGILTLLPIVLTTLLSNSVTGVEANLVAGRDLDAGHPVRDFGLGRRRYRDSSVTKITLLLKTYDPTSKFCYSFLHEPRPVVYVPENITKTVTLTSLKGQSKDKTVTTTKTVTKDEGAVIVITESNLVTERSGVVTETETAVETVTETSVATETEDVTSNIPIQTTATILTSETTTIISTVFSSPSPTTPTPPLSNTMVPRSKTYGDTYGKPLPKYLKLYKIADIKVACNEHIRKNPVPITKTKGIIVVATKTKVITISPYPGYPGTRTSTETFTITKTSTSTSTSIANIPVTIPSSTFITRTIASSTADLPVLTTTTTTSTLLSTSFVTTPTTTTSTTSTTITTTLCATPPAFTNIRGLQPPSGDGNIESIPSGAASPHDCCIACANAQYCNGWVWQGPPIGPVCIVFSSYPGPGADDVCPRGYTELNPITSSSGVGIVGFGTCAGRVVEV